MVYFVDRSFVQLHRSTIATGNYVNSFTFSCDQLASVHERRESRLFSFTIFVKDPAYDLLIICYFRKVSGQTACVLDLFGTTTETFPTDRWRFENCIFSLNVSLHLRDQATSGMPILVAGFREVCFSEALDPTASHQACLVSINCFTPIGFVLNCFEL